MGFCEIRMAPRIITRSLLSSPVIFLASVVYLSEENNDLMRKHNWYAVAEVHQDAY